MSDEILKARWVIWQRGRVTDVRGEVCCGEKAALLPVGMLAEFKSGGFVDVDGSKKKVKGKGPYAGHTYEVD
jgi:hypothetical protein